MTFFPLTQGFIRLAEVNVDRKNTFFERKDDETSWQNCNGIDDTPLPSPMLYGFCKSTSRDLL